MLRWYDYVAAVIFADFMSTFLIAGLYSSNFFMSFFFGLLVMVFNSVWDNAYCVFRRAFENENKGK